MPQRRCFSSIVYNNRLHIVGGKTGEDGPSLNRVDCFDPIKNKWTLGTPMAYDRISPTLSEDKGFLYVYSTNSLERYDPAENSWMVRKFCFLLFTLFYANLDFQIHSVPMFSRRYNYRFLLKTSLILIGQMDEIEVDENSVEVEEFEEIEDEEDEETTAEDVPIERIVVNLENRNNEVNVSSEPIERSVTQQRILQSRFQPHHDEFDEKFIKRYCLETGTITLLPLMNVIRNIEYFIQIPNDN